eukprot:CAMPEP_0119322784 /NCGR_PEP_ID=MMETSP1333-20130426/59159_1 /TAXON_ID=418940 /ORGANISM="Scyphosphaera apsteinii, Strain RCC1455" /LENGTH=207 /DNA_ID=CAMNT_0007330101 /DNA_START=111 /DNA_END=734 /DNA_ORIENTATION=+
MRMLHCRDTVCTDAHESMHESADGEALNLILKRELDRAFEGFEPASADEEANVAALTAKADDVMQVVLQQLADDGRELQGELYARLEAQATSQREEIMAKYDANTAHVQREVDATRAIIDEEMLRITSLNDEYQKLTKPAMLSRDTIVGYIAFIAGLLYVGAAASDLLKVLVHSAGETPETVVNAAIEGVLGACGLGVYFWKKTKSE